MNAPVETFSGVLPQIFVRDAEAAIKFYEDVFGARVLQRSDGPDGRVWYAELLIRGGKVLLADEFPEYGMVAPTTVGGTAVALAVYVDDIQDLVTKARRHGAKIPNPEGVTSRHWGDLFCAVEDPFGHRWSVAAKETVFSQKELDEKRKDFFRGHPEYTPERAAALADEWRQGHPGQGRPNLPPRRPKKAS